MHKFLQHLQDGTDDFVFLDKGILAKYVVVCIDKQADGKFFVWNSISWFI